VGDHVGAASGRDGHAQRVARERRLAVVREREPDQSPRPQIDHRIQVELAVPRLDLGDVTNPTEVHRDRFEVALQQVRELRRRRVWLSQRAAPAALLRSQTLGSHAFRDRVHRQVVIAVNIDELRGLPYSPAYAPNTVSITASSSSRRWRDGDGSPLRCL
jgi:hypothetical protein